MDKKSKEVRAVVVKKDDDSISILVHQNPNWHKETPNHYQIPGTQASEKKKKKITKVLKNEYGIEKKNIELSQKIKSGDLPPNFQLYLFIVDPKTSVQDLKKVAFLNSGILKEPEIEVVPNDLELIAIALQALEKWEAKNG